MMCLSHKILLTRYFFLFVVVLIFSHGDGSDSLVSDV